MYISSPGNRPKMANMPAYCKNLKASFSMPIYVTENQLNGPSGPDCIALHHFGTFTMYLRKIDKIILKNVRNAYLT